jgi:hypothetical protein
MRLFGAAFGEKVLTHAHSKLVCFRLLCAINCKKVLISRFLQVILFMHSPFGRLRLPLKRSWFIDLLLLDILVACLSCCFSIRLHSSLS